MCLLADDGNIAAHSECYMFCVQLHSHEHDSIVAGNHAHTDTPGPQSAQSKQMLIHSTFRIRMDLLIAELLLFMVRMTVNTWQNGASLLYYDMPGSQ